jgi:hypothetical protein
VPGNFLSEGLRELSRKLSRYRLRSTIRLHETERLVALTALGQAAWDGKVDLGAHAALRDRLAGLDARAGELSQAASQLETEKSGLETRRRTELEAFTARRKAVEATKSPVDTALREVRARKSSCEQAIKQSESRQAAIAGRLAGLKEEAERPKLVAEQGELATKLMASRAQLPGEAAEEVRLASESQKHAAHIATIDAEQKAAIGKIDAELTRVRSELQGASQQSRAVGKDRAGTLGDLGKALHDAGARDAVLAEPAARVATIDRGRADAQSAHETSLGETRALPGATMAKFWGVVLGVPLVLAAAGVGTYQYLHRDIAVPVAAQSQAATPQGTGECKVQMPPENGTGVAVRSNCVRHEGTFVDGVLESGKIAYADGRVAEGTFVGGQQFGEGTLTWKDGRRYQGMFAEGRSRGSGVFVAADGTQYRGMFEPGVRLNGIGMRKSPDGSVLVGEFVNGKPSRKMMLVKDGKAEVVEVGQDGSILKKTASPEPNAK